jgi:hypothetical protein
MIDSSHIDRWLEGYRAAWSSDDPEEIAALFADDVHYFTAPHHAPLVGVQAVTDYWLAQEESGLPWTFVSEVIAREGDLYVVRGVTGYPQGTVGDPGAKEYFNLWLVTLTDDDRAREFVEYFMRGD